MALAAIGLATDALCEHTGFHRADVRGDEAAADLAGALRVHPAADAVVAVLSPAVRNRLFALSAYVHNFLLWYEGLAPIDYTIVRSAIAWVIGSPACIAGDVFITNLAPANRFISSISICQACGDCIADADDAGIGVPPVHGAAGVDCIGSSGLAALMGIVCLRPDPSISAAGIAPYSMGAILRSWHALPPDWLPPPLTSHPHLKRPKSSFLLLIIRFLVAPS